MMHKIAAVMKQEILFLLHTPPVLVVILFAPIVYPFLYSYLYINKFETKVPVVIVDLDRSAQSRDLIRSLDATEQLHVIGIQYDASIARHIIESDEAQAVFVIPPDFERRLLRYERPVMRAYINTTRFMVAVDAGKGLTEAIASLGHDMLVETFESTGLTHEIAARWSQPIVPRSEGLANTIESYGDFIIPALLLLILQQSLFAGAAAGSAGMERRGRRFAVEIGVSVGIIGRACVYIGLYCVYALLFFTLQYHIWHIPFSGHAALLAALVIVHLSTITIAGFLVGSFCRSRLTALFIGMFTSYPMFLLSGIAWPIESMPTMLRIISQCLPSTHFFPVALSAARLNAPWSAVAPHICALGIMLVVFTIALYVRMKIMKREEISIPVKSLK